MSCYETSLRLAEENRLESIAFPAISTGIFGYPPEAAARVAVDVVRQFASSSVKLVRFVCFDSTTTEIYQGYLSDATPGGH
jgi:O-acetyl-ADP-ribose deacetylase (regulator of RNase III)